MGERWIVQVAALGTRAEADAFKGRLSRKGYPVRISEEGGFFKVQVGPYGRKSEAQVVEKKLQRDEKAKTWIKPA